MSTMKIFQRIGGLLLLSLVCSVVEGIYTTNGVNSKPLMGWMTWERYTCELDCVNFPDTCISEKLIMSIADAMVEEGFLAAGYNYVQIDDCWSTKERDDDGNIQADPDRFPHGIKYLADYVHKKGLKLGIYGDIGAVTCGGFIGFNVSGVPDAQADEQLQRDTDLLVSWGVDSLKVDGCSQDPITSAKYMNVTYPKLGVALKESAKKYGRTDLWYSCSWPDYVGDILCNRTRTEPCVPLHDIATNCTSARLWSDIADTWTSATTNGRGVKDIIDFWRTNPQFSEVKNSLPPTVSYFNDPDQLLVGNNGLSYTEAQIQFAMWAMFAAPLIMSTEIRNGSMSKEMKEILLNEHVIAIANDDLGLQATFLKSESSVLYYGGTSVWNKTLADGSIAVAMLNTGDFGNVGKTFGNFNISFTLEEIGLPCTKEKFMVHDVLAKKKLGIHTGGFWAEVDESSMMLVTVACHR